MEILLISALSALIALAISVHIAFVFQYSSMILVVIIGFIVNTWLFFFTPKKAKAEAYKTISFLSFLLPLSSILHIVMVTSEEMSYATSETAKLGIYMGAIIGGASIFTMTLAIGVSLGILFYILYRNC